jgi:hypothetical protein
LIIGVPRSVRDSVRVAAKLASEAALVWVPVPVVEPVSDGDVPPEPPVQDARTAARAAAVPAILRAAR